MATGKTSGPKAAKKKTINRQREDRRASRTAHRNLRFVTVFSLHFLVLFHVAGLDRLQFERARSDYFEVRATLGARDDLALVDFLFFHIQIGFAFRTKNHDSSAPIRCHFLDTLD